MRKKQKVKKYFAAVLAVVTVWSVFYLLRNEWMRGDWPAELVPKSARENSSQNNSPKVKTVLWLDAADDNKPKPQFTGEGTEMKSFSKCEYHNCRLLYQALEPDNSSSARKQYLEADALLFRGSVITNCKPPRRRNPNQVFIFVESEAIPLGNHGNRKPGPWEGEWAKLFNWTFTYRLDSDFPNIYGAIRQKENPLPEVERKDYNKLFQNKVNRALWFVSHCETKSRRQEYVDLLSKSIQVDVLGACGKSDSCSKFSTTRSECEEKMAQKYMFYLSFENTFHTDYVTEKFYNWLTRDVVSVVRGGANYSQFAPPGTYINARDFSSPEDLGKFLNDLAADKDRYIDILRRKDMYKSIKHHGIFISALCDLCEWLNHIDDHRKTYDDIAEWWGRGYYNFKNDKTNNWLYF